MKVMVEMTVNDILMGEPMSGDRCALALAIQRALPADLHVDVCGERGGAVVVSRNWISDGHMIGVLPPEAMRFVDAFDEGWAVAPISFPLELVGTL